jgi:arylsulfatase A-like enzyme/tetratricopeptide (TPR) repeat protein
VNRAASLYARWTWVVSLVLGALGGVDLQAARPARDARAAAAARPNVLLVTVDTLRPDALGWVAGRNETPHFDALALAGLRLPAAVSPVPLTLPAHTALMSARLPRHHGVRDNGQVVARDVPLLAAHLRAHGYSTGAFVSGYPLRATFGLERGFEHYDDSLPSGAEGWQERPAPDTARAASSWLGQAREPWFAWVHFYDPHDPYTPPRVFWRPGVRGAYEGEVAFVDHAFGQLMQALPRGTRTRLTIMTADHAESFGEHDEHGHGFFIYDTTLLVPLVFHWPGHIQPAQSRAAARLIDIAPTLLELLGLPALPQPDGVSLVKLLRGDAQQVPPAYLESLQPWIGYGWAPLKALRSAAFKLIEAPRRELYDLAADPGETRSVPEGRAQVIFELERGLARVEARPEAGSRGAEDPAVLEQLRALGYVGGAVRTGSAPAGLPDPKDRRALRELLSEGEARLRAGDTSGALQRFEAVLAREPGNRFATLRAGIALLKAGRLAPAAERLRQALAQDPNQAETHYALADALTRAGRLAEALPAWFETVRLQPRRVAAWSNLGLVLHQLQRPAEAVRALREATRLEPTNPLVLANLGFAERAAGDLRAALATWQRAAGDTPPESVAFSASLGLGLLKLGQPSQALPWLAAARAGQPDYAEALLEAARLHRSAGRSAAARQALRRAVAADPALAAQAERDAGLAELLADVPVKRD